MTGVQTCALPICDYGNLANSFRPGHADYTYWQKYGIRDYRGGGRSSARETTVRVAAGAIAKKWLREQYGIEVISPHRNDRQQPTQDGRPLRRYRKRWTIERLFAWLQNYRRLATRWEYHIENFFGMVRLGCMKILLTNF